MAQLLALTTIHRKRSTALEASYTYKGKTYRKIVKNQTEGLQWRSALWATLGLVDVTECSLEQLIRDYTEVKEGILYWTISDTTGWKIKGEALGYGSTKGGYRQIILAGSSIYYHRAVWLSTTGAKPRHQIDHIDHNKHNNCIENLRDVTQGENLRNKRKQRNNTSGFTGVKPTPSGKFTASITVNGQSRYLGTFKAVESAIMAREVAKATLGFTASHGL
jgi:hypothetical protein